MNEETRQRLAAGLEPQPGDWRTALRDRLPGQEEFLDTAVIGGLEVKDILAGKIAESRVPPDVLRAFHDQYPGLGGSFTAAVQRLARDPARLQGFINGVKGKLFEEHYVDWLNQGHLPAGYHAELAHAANQPAWDIAIRDGHGQVHERLQLKATEQFGHMRTALALHPNIEVVAPHEAYLHAAHHVGVAGHLVDSHQSLAGLDATMHGAVEHAEAANPAGFHLPLLAVAVAAGQGAYFWYRGRWTALEAVRRTSERGVLALLAEAAFALSLSLGVEPMVGLPVSLGVRVAGGQALHNRRRRREIQQATERVIALRRRLEAREVWAAEEPV